MLKKLLGRGGGDQTATPRYAPYAQAESNQIYNLLFCDTPDAFKPAPGEQPVSWQAILFADPPKPDSVLALAQDATQEARIRALAYNWLAAHGHAVPARLLFGVIVEIPVRAGLDSLAVYAGGTVRYINYSGNVTIVERASADIELAGERLLHVSQDVVNRIGPWKKTRLPPPVKGKIRVSFVVSDGLYFGEGLAEVMQKDPHAGIVFHEATKLLQLVVKLVAGESPEHTPKHPAPK